jgi:hypothetical protein
MREIDIEDDGEDFDDLPSRNTKDAALLKQLQNGSSLVRMKAVMSSNATPKVLLFALDLPEKDEAIKIEAVKNKNANSAVIKKALADKSLKVKQEAVKSPHMTEELLSEALDSAEVSVRRAAIKNPEITAKLLAKAFTDTDPEVRVDVLDHKLCTPEIVLKAIRDPEYIVKYWAVTHNKLSVLGLGIAMKDKDPKIAAKARERYEKQRNTVKFKDDVEE